MKYKWDNYYRPVIKLDESKDGGLKVVTNSRGGFSEWKGNEAPPAVPYKKLEPTASQYAISIEGLIQFFVLFYLFITLDFH